METIREILEGLHDFAYYSKGYTAPIKQEKLDQALLSLRQLIKSKMPKKKEYIIPSRQQGTDFNEAISLMHQALEEVFNE